MSWSGGHQEVLWCGVSRAAWLSSPGMLGLPTLASPRQQTGQRRGHGSGMQQFARVTGSGSGRLAHSPPRAGSVGAAGTSGMVPGEEQKYPGR